MKERLDVLLVKRNLASSREKAKAIIMSGNVFVDGQREDKAVATFKEDVLIEVKGTPMKYDSRGGFKLEKAIELWQVPLKDKICMDVGSSPGGFTDCMLQNGAVKVYAVDVGTNQLAWKLRQDERVVSMEKTNIRYVTPEDIADPIAFFSVDVAFISLKKVLEPVKALLTPDGVHKNVPSSNFTETFPSFAATIPRCHILWQTSQIASRSFIAFNSIAAPHIFLNTSIMVK